MSEKNEGTMTASEQIDLLASFIMREVEGEPSRSEGAIPCVIRIVQQLKAENEKLREALCELSCFDYRLGIDAMRDFAFAAANPSDTPASDS